MPVTNREAFELKRVGKYVIVICVECGQQVWTDDSVYVEGQDEWYCSACNGKLLTNDAEKATSEGGGASQ